MDSQLIVPLYLSLASWLSTSFGALFVLFGDTPNLKALGLVQGFIGGVFLSLCFLDRVYNAIKTIGFLKGNIYFYAGVMVLAIIANIITGPTLARTSDAKSKHKNGKENERCSMKKHRRQVLYSGIVAGIAIKLHNLPEAMSYFLGSMKTLVDMDLALAIVLHHIPEGVAMALPVYFATQSKWQAFKQATLSGFLKPFCVIFMGLNPETLECLLVAGGGVMAFLTVHEILPLAFEYAGKRQAGKAALIGLAFGSASIYFAENNLKFEEVK